MSDGLTVSELIFKTMMNSNIHPVEVYFKKETYLIANKGWLILISVLPVLVCLHLVAYAHTTLVRGVGWNR